MRVGLSFDLRNPEPWRRPWAEHYAATLDLIVEAERLGIDIVKVAEHHLFDDGYSPQPLTFLAAAAARTRTIRLATGIMIAPLHSAVEMAEQAAVVDGLSGGRLELALGAGYRVPEYELYGIEFGARFRLFGERVTEMRRLWSEGGITPRPVQEQIPLWAGLRGPRTARLAGRLGMHMLYLPRDNWDDYLTGLAEGGHSAESARLGGSLQAMVADDPESAFAVLAPRIEHNWNSYARYRVEGTDEPVPAPLTATDFRAAGPQRSYGFGVLTPEDAAAQVHQLAAGRPVDTVYLAGAVSGVIDDLAYRNVELIASRLKPLLAVAAASA